MSIINWPCSDLPFRKTLRASAIRGLRSHNVGWVLVTLILFLNCAVGFGYHAASVLGCPLAQDPAGSVGTMNVFGIVALPLGFALFMQLRMQMKFLSQPFRHGSKEAKRLRDEWAAFERASREFDRSHASKRSDFATLLDFAKKAPDWPLHHYVELDEFKQEVLPTTIPNRPSDTVNYSTALHGLLLSLFSSVTLSPQVTGRVGDGLVQVRMVTPTTQFWSFITILRTHVTLSVQVQTGVLWWTERGPLLNGTPYAGDVQVIRGSLRDFPILRYIPFPIGSVLNTFRTEGAWGFWHLLILLMLIIPVYVLFFALAVFILLPQIHTPTFAGYMLLIGIPLAALSIYNAWKHGELKMGQFQSTWDSSAGDLSDLIGISRIRRANEQGFGVILSSAQKAAIEDARQHVRLCCMNAIGQLTPKARR
jgi:hypothetical protein